MQVTQVMRFKVFAKGTCGWAGLVIGGPSLEASPLGLGLMPCSGGHYLQTLGLTVPRVEGPEVSDRLEEFFSQEKWVQAAAMRVPPGCVSTNIGEEESSDEDEDEEDDATGWMKGSLAVPIPRASMSPVVYLGNEISIRPGETAKAEGGISRALIGTLQVMSNNSGVVSCDETTWETGRGGLTLRNRGHMEVTIVLGDIVGAAWSAPGVGLTGERMEKDEKGVDASGGETSTGAEGSRGEA